MSDSNLDINAIFRSGGRSIEWLDEINKASIVMPPQGDFLRGAPGPASWRAT